MDCVKKVRKIMFLGNLFIRFILLFAYIMTSLYWYRNQTFFSYTYFFGIIIYFFVYERFARLYQGFKSGNMRIREIITAQMLSLLWADGIGWIICCISIHKVKNVVSVFILVLEELLIVTVWAYVMNKMYMRFHEPRRVFLVCPEGDSAWLIKKIKERPTKFRIVEYSDTFSALSKAKEISEKFNCVIAFNIEKASYNELLHWCITEKKRFYRIADLDDVQIRGMRTVHILDTPMLMYEERELHRVELGLKRLFDILLSLTALLILWPLFLLVSIAIKMEDGGPVFFCQDRITENKKIFRIIKFRSMKLDSEKYGIKPVTENDDRITKIGRIIRPFRIDELPQIFNILKGDMSLVGPRPERKEFYYAYEKEVPEFGLRSRMKGGLTGYAQIYGKYNTSPRDKLILDLIYIENWSLLLDLKLLLLTIQICLKKESTEGFSLDRAKELMNFDRMMIHYEEK